MVFTLGLVFLFGKVIALCNGAFYRNFGSKGRAVCYATGFIGTPVHEASHALMCLIFGHKIVEIKFFPPARWAMCAIRITPKIFTRKLAACS